MSCNDNWGITHESQFNDISSFDSVGESHGSSNDCSASAPLASADTSTSRVESQIISSSQPINIDGTEEINVNGHRGIHANKSEEVEWRGELPLSQYPINQDCNPEVITKKSEKCVDYVQELAVRYLKPPTPPKPGDIIITQEPNKITAPAPPLVIRQQPPRPATPEPLIIREAPPEAPAAVAPKHITISGKVLPPPPRKVVIERLPNLPTKPQSIFIERWLPYAEQKRRVIFQKPQEADPVPVQPRNVIIQWDTPCATIRKDIKYLGVCNANPAEYVRRYGASLKRSSDLPQYVHDIATPNGLVLAAQTRTCQLPELFGDVNALKLIDLEREGLGEYRSFVNTLSSNGAGDCGSTTTAPATFNSTSGCYGY